MAKNGKNVKTTKRGGSPAFVFILTYLGALVYFLDKANGFWEVVLAFLQAAVWPALLAHKVFTVLQV